MGHCKNTARWTTCLYGWGPSRLTTNDITVPVSHLYEKVPTSGWWIAGEVSRQPWLQAWCLCVQFSAVWRGSQYTSPSELKGQLREMSVLVITSKWRMNIRKSYKESTTPSLWRKAKSLYKKTVLNSSGHFLVSDHWLDPSHLESGLIVSLSEDDKLPFLLRYLNILWVWIIFRLTVSTGSRYVHVSEGNTIFCNAWTSSLFIKGMSHQFEAGWRWTSLLNFLHCSFDFLHFSGEQRAANHWFVLSK